MNDAMQRVLEDLGVTETTLTPEEKSGLDRDGYIMVSALLDPAVADQIRLRMEALWEQEGDRAGLEVHQQPGTRRLADLVNKGAVFDAVWLHPKVLAATWRLIGHPFKLFSLNARDALPGQGHQALHADWGPRAADEPCRVVNSVWMIDPFTEETGATRIVPGSHRLPGQVQDYVADPEATHADQRLALGDVGTVLVYNAHSWHGGTQNRSPHHRRGLHSAYVDRHFAQQTDQRQYLREETRARLSPAARFLLDVD